jgi:hypothetical protein
MWRLSQLSHPALPSKRAPIRLRQQPHQSLRRVLPLKLRLLPLLHRPLLRQRPPKVRAALRLPLKLLPPRLLLQPLRLHPV